jgi:AraC-like DNA-binding protein
MKRKEAKKIIDKSKSIDFINFDVFNYLTNQIENLESVTSKNEKKSFTSKDATIAGIPTDVTKSIMTKLVKFEKEKKYLTPKISLSDTSIELNTNSKYLSKIINIYKKKSFSQYINDLRIEYLLKKLDDDPIYTKYKIAAIAKEIGFNTPNAFSKAFLKKVGMPPSQYIKDLNR